MSKAKTTKTATIYEALLQFKKTVGTITRQTDGYGYLYASLSDIYKAIKQPLLDINLSVIHKLQPDDMLQTDIVHTVSGESVSCLFSLHVGGKGDSQALGSAITYARRYAIGALLDLDIDDDDDGVASSGRVTHDISVKTKGPDEIPDSQKPWLDANHEKWSEIISWVQQGNKPTKLYNRYKISKAVMAELQGVHNGNA